MDFTNFAGSSSSGPSKTPSNDVHSVKHYLSAIGDSKEWEHKAVMNSKNAENLVSAVLQNTVLTKLAVNGNFLGQDGGYEFAKLIKQNTTLTILDISMIENPFERFEDTKPLEIGEKGCMAMFRALRYNTTLRELRLSGQQLAKAGTSTGRRSMSSIKLIAQVLETSNVLTSLDISANNIGDDGITHIASALESNHSITALYLDKNELKKCVPLINKALEKNHTITKISLRSNKIEPQALQPVIEMLKNNLNRTLVDMPTHTGTLSTFGMSKHHKALDDLLEKNKQYLKSKKEIKDRLPHLKGTPLINELLRVEIREKPRDRV